MKTAVLELNPQRYGRLLARKLPTVIRTEEENERLVAELKQLDGAHAILNEVSMNGLRVSAVRINGEPTHSHGVTAQFSVERPVAGVRFLALEHQVSVPI